MNKVAYGTLICITVFSIFSLAGCGTSKKEALPKENPTDNLVAAKNSAKSALDFMYKGKTSGLSNFTTSTPDDIKQMFVKYFEDRVSQTSSSENDQANNYFLILGGEKHSYNEIFKGYADTYYDQIKTIGDAKITDIKLSENSQTANVTATFKPIDSSSELEPVEDARDKAFGGLDNRTIMRNSKSDNFLAINKMIQLKLYSVYYGDMGKIANKAPDDVKIKFSMTKSGDHYDVSAENLMILARFARNGIPPYSD
ncbi:hypothetical protein KF282_0967 [Lactococcus lactis subsp. lactis]|uniref:DUF5105 domain-containing protein n=1 Tax=Lactococcus lactis subsp. lactis TaxID=1360 RepID=A0A0V8CZ39_LACLL|nr:hypothetical protein [Lactococcus lactis]KSU06570.1 hypothetical protein KF282_0967 [Lactococcus lactis subsp. lactis]